MYPKLVEVLDELKKHYRLFIVSNCEEGYIQCFLNAHKLHDYFEDFEYPGRTRASKAENIRMIIERNELETPIYVGDTQGDANSSQKAGVPFVYAKYGFGNVDEYEFAIDSFAELPEVLKQIDLLGNA